MQGYETEEVRTRHVAALVEELARAQGANDKEWEKAVRSSLEAFGHKAQAPAKRSEKRPRARAAEKRKGK